jgi:hypothetical protein
MTRYPPCSPEPRRSIPPPTVLLGAPRHHQVRTTPSSFVTSRPRQIVLGLPIAWQHVRPNLGGLRSSLLPSSEVVTVAGISLDPQASPKRPLVTVSLVDDTDDVANEEPSQYKTMLIAGRTTASAPQWGRRAAPVGTGSRLHHIGEPMTESSHNVAT